MEDKSKKQFLTLEEIKKLIQEKEHPEALEHYELEFDENSNLYSSKCFVYYGGTLLENHYVVGRLEEHYYQVDWAKVSNGYDARSCAILNYTYAHPLVWTEELPREAQCKFILVGKLATETHIEDRDWLEALPVISDEPLYWFARELPTPSHPAITNPPLDVPKDMIIWNLLTSDWEAEVYVHEYKYESFLNDPKNYNDDISEVAEKLYFNVDRFRIRIKHIEDKYGSQQIAKIIRLLRRDWKHIVAKKLFGIDKISAEHVEAFREMLFEGLDYEMERWENEAIQPEKQEHSESFSLLTDTCRAEHKEAKVISELRAACKGTAVGLWKVIRENEALGYLGTKGMQTAKIYRAIVEFFGELPYSERNFRDARDKR